MGRSPRGSTHEKFKEKWGAKAVAIQYGHLTLSKKRTYRSVLEPSPLERFVSETWKKVPLFLTRRVGHLAARHIP